MKGRTQEDEGMAVAPQKAIFCSLSEENNSTKKKKKKKVVLVVAGRQKVPSLLEDHRIVFTTLSNVPAICRTLTPVCSTLKSLSPI